jgi:hypothetical protein
MRALLAAHDAFVDTGNPEPLERFNDAYRAARAAIGRAEEKS